VLIKPCNYLAGHGQARLKKKKVSRSTGQWAGFCGLWAIRDQKIFERTTSTTKPLQKSKSNQPSIYSNHLQIIPMLRSLNGFPQVSFTHHRQLNCIFITTTPTNLIRA